MPPRKAARLAVQVAPFVVLVDDREKRPYTFEGFTAPAPGRRVPLAVPTETAHLDAGDYGIVGAPGVRVERKSLADLYGTIGQHRDRFEREIQRLGALDDAAVIIEAEWWQIVTEPPPRSRLNPASVVGTILAWRRRYPRVHWLACGDRRLAEIVTFAVLKRYWTDVVENAGGE